MKAATLKLFKNQFFLLLLNSVFAYTAFCAVIIATLNVPEIDVYDSNLQEIILVFEDYDF